MHRIVSRSERWISWQLAQGIRHVYLVEESSRRERENLAVKQMSQLDMFNRLVQRLRAGLFSSRLDWRTCSIMDND